MAKRTRKAADAPFEPPEPKEPKELKRFALLDSGGRVVNVVALDAAPDPANIEGSAVEVPPGEEVEIGGSYEGGVYAPPLGIRIYGKEGAQTFAVVDSADLIVNTVLVVPGAPFEPGEGLRLVEGEFAIGGTLAPDGTYVPPPEIPFEYPGMMQEGG